MAGTRRASWNGIGVFKDFWDSKHHIVEAVGITGSFAFLVFLLRRLVLVKGIGKS